MNSELVSALKVVLADHYAVYFKAQGYHWNVEGVDFAEYHGLFANVYDDSLGAVDSIAENIRKLQSYAPFKMTRFSELTTVAETEVGPDVKSMTADLLIAVETSIRSTNAAFALANGMAMEPGIANDLAARDGCLKKWAWQLRASLS